MLKIDRNRLVDEHGRPVIIGGWGDPMKRLIILVLLLLTGCSAWWPFEQEIPTPSAQTDQATVTLRIDPEHQNRLTYGGRPEILAAWYPGPHGLITGHWMAQDHRLELFRFMRERGVTLLRALATSGSAFESQPWLHPYMRSGQGKTLNARELGKPGSKFDLDRWNPTFFAAWRGFVTDAKNEGIRLQLVLLDGAHTRQWHEDLGASFGPWRYIGLAYDYLHAGNALQGVEFRDTGQYLRHPEVRRRHQEFVRKLVSELGGFDGIYEIINEGQTRAPDYAAWFAGVESAAISSDGIQTRVWMPRHVGDHRDNAGHMIPGSGGLSDRRARILYHDLVEKSGTAVVIADDDCCSTSATATEMRDKTAIVFVAGAVPSSMEFSATRLDAGTRARIEAIGSVSQFLIENGIDLRGMEPRELEPDVWALQGNGRALVFSLLGGQVEVLGAKKIIRQSGEVVNGSVAQFGRRELAIAEFSEPDTSPCPDDPHHLCMVDGEFDVSVRWDANDGRTGDGKAIAFLSSTGAFYLGGNANAATVFVTIIDGRGADSPNWWVDYASLTHVELWITVRQVGTGLVQTYYQPFGQPTVNQDREAFPAEAGG